MTEKGPIGMSPEEFVTGVYGIRTNDRPDYEFHNRGEWAYCSKDEFADALGSISDELSKYPPQLLWLQFFREVGICKNDKDRFIAFN